MKNCFILLCTVLLAACQNHQPAPQTPYTELTLKIDSILHKEGFNGIVFLSTDSIDLYSKAIGYADLDQATKLGFNDQFIIGSISKQITAVLVLKAYEAHQINLYDTIGYYLPDLQQIWANQVTIHQLLTHTHGIIRLDAPLEFDPGTQFHYSQLGYELLAQILQTATGKSFEQLSTELFERHGLDHTFHPANTVYQHLVNGYQENDHGQLVLAPNSLRNYAAAGSFISNATDLKKWNALLYSSQLVSTSSLDLMRTKYATRAHPIFETVDYGYGLLFQDGTQQEEIGALGYAPGFVTACYYYPQTGLHLIVLENTAKQLNDFTQTFKVHTELMKLVRQQTNQHAAQ